MMIWGNHSNTMHPDYENAFIGKTPLTEKIQDQDWLEKDFIKKVQN